MSFEILNPALYKRTKRIGGFTFVDGKYIDNVDFFRADITKSGFDKTPYTWKQLADPITNNRYHAMGTYSDYLYTWGGRVGSDPVNNNLQRYNIVTGVWEDLGNHGAARYKVCGDVIGNKFIIFGGTAVTVDDESPTRKVTIIDLDTLDVRESGTDFSASGITAVNDACGVGVPSENAFYVYGGYAGSSSISTQFRKFDLTTETWSNPGKAGVAPTDYFDSTLSLVGSKLYLHGGFKTGEVAQVQMWSFDLGTQQWARLHDCPIATAQAISRGIGDYVYTFGGDVEPDTSLYRYNTDYDGIAVHDPEAWEDITDNPFGGATEGAGAVHNGLFYATVGSKLYVYSPDVDQLEFVIERIY